MRFAQNGLYIEAYLKCANCGLLIFDKNNTHIMHNDKRYCSQWCIDWSDGRAERERKTGPVKWVSIATDTRQTRPDK